MERDYTLTFQLYFIDSPLYCDQTVPLEESHLTL